MFDEGRKYFDIHIFAEDLTLVILTFCLGAFCGMTRQSQMMKTIPREIVAAVNQRGSPMRMCRQLTQSDHFLGGTKIKIRHIFE